jgi:hypothetical protein
MKPIKLKDVKLGDYIRRKPDALKTYTRGSYIRDLNWNTMKPYNQYALEDTDDICREIFLKGSTIVFIDFEF